MADHSKRVRIQLDMTIHEAQHLDELVELCELRSRSDAVRAALAVIDWAFKETRGGRKIVALGGDVASELVMPGITTSIHDER